MKYALIALLFLSTNAFANLNAQVNGSTIDWPNTGGWMQVQNATTYGSACDGFIDTCAVSAGTYHVIDHSNGTRQDNIVVGNTITPVISNAQNIKKQCDFNLGRVKNTCLIQCPGGMRIERVRRCYAESSDNSRFIGTNFTSSDERLWCNATTNVTNFFIVAEIECR